MKLEDDSLMPFGKHEGDKMEDIPASYLLWLHGQLTDKINDYNSGKRTRFLTKVQYAVYLYIQENYDVLIQELKYK
jgi:uncharacterized protein (DUF3820 family)